VGRGPATSNHPNQEECLKMTKGADIKKETKKKPAKTLKEKKADKKVKKENKDS
jgi:hypothetical protein